jgi:hypothetical protein
MKKGRLIPVLYRTWLAIPLTVPIPSSPSLAFNPDVCISKLVIWEICHISLIVLFSLYVYTLVARRRLILVANMAAHPFHCHDDGINTAGKKGGMAAIILECCLAGLTVYAVTVWVSGDDICPCSLFMIGLVNNRVRFPQLYIFCCDASLCVSSCLCRTRRVCPWIEQLRRNNSMIAFMSMTFVSIVGRVNYFNRS